MLYRKEEDDDDESETITTDNQLPEQVQHLSASILKYLGGKLEDKELAQELQSCNVIEVSSAITYLTGTEQQISDLLKTCLQVWLTNVGTHFYCHPIL